MRVLPQPTSFLLGLSLKSKKLPIAGVLPIHPGHPVAYLVRLRIDAIALNTRSEATVPITLTPLQRCPLAKAQAGERLFGTLAKGLCLLRSVDFRQAHADTLALFCENRERVAIAHAHHRIGGRHSTSMHAGGRDCSHQKCSRAHAATCSAASTLGMPTGMAAGASASAPGPINQVNRRRACRASMYWRT